MKTTNFCQWAAVTSLTLGGLSQTSLADGPADLEALAQKAREAAEDSTKPAKKAAKPAEEKIEEKVVQAEEVVEKAKVAAAEAVEEKAPQKAVPIDLAKRAEKMGLIANLSPDVAAVMTLNRGERLWGEVAESAVGQILLGELAENDVDLNDPDSPAAQLAPLFQEEVMLVSGEGTPKQLENLLSISGLSDKFQTALMLRMATGDFDAVGLGNAGPFGALAQGVAANPDFLVNLVAVSEMPPILIAARVTDEEKRNEFAAVLGMGAGMALALGGEEMPFLSNAQAEVAGISFQGLAVDGKTLIASLQEEMNFSETLESFMDPASAQDVADSLAEKNLVLLGGVSDEAIYLYLGSNAQDIPLVADPAQGLAATKDFAFADPYLDEELVGVFWMEDDLVAKSATGQAIFGDYIDGIRLGLADNDALGNTKQLEKNLDRLEALEKKFLTAGHSQTAAAVAFLKADGLYTEGFGGYVDPQYDWESPHALGSAAQESFFSVQSIVDAEASKLTTRYFEAAFETVYEMASLVADLEEIPVTFEPYADGFGLFDEKMKGDALALWEGLRMTEAGLGMESIFEVDLSGTWPTVPGVPQAIIDNGLAPRLSYVAPVTDRAKLGESWTEMNKAITGLLKTASELGGQEIPMQRPMNSENNGLKTWFFPIPMQTDDFVPSITLDDKVVVMGTSKERAVTLAQAAQEQGDGETGVIMVMNFEPLQAFLSNWFELVEENPEEILQDEEALLFFEENQETIREVIAGLEQLDSWRTHTRLVDEQLRTSSHFKTK